LQIAGLPPPGKIVRCSQCGFIFPAPITIPTEITPVAEFPPDTSAAPATWIDWQSSQILDAAPLSVEPTPRPLRRPVRLRRRRPAFPWVALVVGLAVGIAAIGLLFVLVVALWPSGKTEKSPGSNQHVAANSLSLQGWHELVPTDRRFRILMPGTPKIEDSVHHTRLGSLRLKVYTLENSDCTFEVWHGDLDSQELQDVSLEDWIDASRDIYIVRSNAQLLSEKDIILGEFWGKETRYVVAEKHTLFRRYAVNRRLYTLFVSRDKTEPHEDMVLRFLDSFQILH
jgi:hypothetical protein